MKPAVSPVDEYIAAQPKEAQVALRLVRDAIRTALANAQETITYKMPTYKQDGKALIYFAAWKAHYSVYPASPELLAAFKDDLAPYEIEKSTIRFPYSEAVPTALIERIATFRAAEAAAGVKPKTPARRTTRR
jgi:uncharacterized protein YdhG (YjbR/CyaY superfamily)